MASVLVDRRPQEPLTLAPEEVNTFPAKSSGQLTGVTLLSSSSLSFPALNLQAPFDAIKTLFDHLAASPETAAQLNQTYPARGIYKAAAQWKKDVDQKFTIDLSPHRLDLIPSELRNHLAPFGFTEVVQFFENLMETHLPVIMQQIGLLSGNDFTPLHREQNVNFRLCDYNPATANPASFNGCGAHRDYGTFSIIFQDGTSGLEIESTSTPGQWVPVPPTSTVILAGWSAYILSGAKLHAVRHRVRRIPGKRRLSAVFFVAPDLHVKLQPVALQDPSNADPAAVVACNKRFSECIRQGTFDIAWFKDVMGKKWRWREGNLEIADADVEVTQDDEIEKLVHA